MAMRPKKSSCHCLLVPYQNQILSRPGCGKGVGLSSLYSQGFSPRTGTVAVGIDSGGNYVLACRQIAVVVSALSKTSYVLAIDGQDKEEIVPKIWHPVNEQTTGIRRCSGRTWLV